MKITIEKSWTPEPWRNSDHVNIQSGPIGALAYVSTAGARGRTLAEAEANGDRIVQCVNACAGLAEPAAELARLREACQAVLDGAIVHNRQEQRITNYAVNLCRSAVSATERSAT